MVATYTRGDMKSFYRKYHARLHVADKSMRQMPRGGTRIVALCTRSLFKFDARHVRVLQVCIIFKEVYFTL